MKQTFNIPVGCKTVSVEQIGNQIITSFEPEKYVPKVGDLVKRTAQYGSVVFGQVKDSPCLPLELGECITPEGKYYNKWICCSSGSFEQLTPEEFQAEFEKLGYVYDFETHTAHKKRKRVEVGGRYFYSDMFLESNDHIEDSDDVDDLLYEAGNYFETEQECQKYCDYMKECSIKYFNK